MISTREVFDRMKRYRRERNELRQQMEKIKGLPKQILALQQQVKCLEEKLKLHSATINVEQLKNEILLELENKMQDILSNSQNLSLLNSLEEENTEVSTSLEEEINSLISDEERNISTSEDKVLQAEKIDELQELELEDVKIESDSVLVESLAK